MSDPKTSPVNTNQRTSVSGLCSLLCGIVAVVWAYFQIPRQAGYFEFAVVIAVPIVASGALILLGTFVRSLVPFERIRFPLNFFFPILWNLLAMFLVTFIETQESSTTALQPILQPITNWQSPRHLVPVFLGQFIVLSLFALIQRGEE